MNIRHIYDVLRDRWIIVAGTIVAGLLLAYFGRHLVPTTFDGTAKVLIVNENVGRDPSVSSLDLPSLATSTSVLQTVHNTLANAPSVEDLKNHVKARVAQHSSIMDIGYSDADPNRATDVPNAVADELTRYYREISTHRYNENERYLDAAVTAQQQRLSALDHQLQNVTARDSFVGSDRSIDSLTARLDDLQSQRGTAYATLVGDSAAASSETGQSPALSNLIQHEILQGDSTYRNLHDGVAKDAAQLALDKAAYTAHYPGRAGEIAKVQAEQQQLAAQQAQSLRAPDAYSATQASSIAEARKSQALVAGDRARLAALDSLIAESQRRVADLPTTGADASVLRMQRDASQAEYLALSTRRAEAVANRAEAASLGSVVVIDRAVRADEQLGGGSRRLALVLSILLLAAGIGSAFLADAIDPRLRRVDQVETLYGQPLIATLEKI